MGSDRNYLDMALEADEVGRAGLRTSVRTNREQHRRIFKRIQAVALRRDDDEVAGLALPFAGLGAQTHPTGQHLQRRFGRAVVLAEAVARGQGDQRLPQEVLVAAVDGLRGTPAVVIACQIQLFRSQTCQ